MNNEKLYTAADFASYHAGTMPVHDMHALEKAALEDPFLSDALEGYVYTPTATNDIEKLQEKLKLGKQITSPVKLITNKTWWRVAASIVGILGIGYLFYATNKNEDTNSLAKNEELKEIKIDSINKKINADSIPMLDVTFNDNSKLQTGTVTEKDLAIKLDTTNNRNKSFNTTKATQFNGADDATTTFNTTEANVPAAAPIISNKSEGEINLEKNKEVTANTTWAKDYKADKKIDQLNTQKQQALNYYDYNGYIKKPSGGPMQNANVYFNNTFTQTDKNGRFNFKATDTIVNASLTAAGFAKQDIVLNTNTTPVFKLDYDNKNLEEVVVTSEYAAKRKSVSGNVASLSKERKNVVTINDALTGKVAGVQVKTEADKVFGDSIKLRQQNIEADKDTKEFTNYIIKNIKPELDDKGNEVKGKVILSFTVNKKGYPREIKIVQSLNADCDEQAIELLQNGPKWNLKKGDRRNVVINF
jgi:hypothetical protein